MNMPKRASCHHCMRRSRSATLEVGGPAWSAPACAAAVTGSRAAEAPAAFNKLRRESVVLSMLLIKLAQNGYGLAAPPKTSPVPYCLATQNPYPLRFCTIILLPLPVSPPVRPRLKIFPQRRIQPELLDHAPADAALENLADL